MKSTKGITLVALVVTIVVLVILAGVSIRLILGENGVVSKAQQAEQEQLKEMAKQEINFIMTNIEIDSYDEKQRMPTLQEVANKLEEDSNIEYVTLTSQAIATLGKLDIGDNKLIYTKLKEYSYEFGINDSLQLASIDGVKISSNTVSKEDYDNLQNKYDELKQKYEALEESKSLTFVSDSRSSCTIPQGVTEAYVLFSNGTNNTELACSISGTTIVSQEEVSYSTAIDSYSNNLRSTLVIYKLKLNGEGETISIYTSGGSGNYRAWTSTVMY